VESSLREFDRVADRIRLHRQVDSRSVVVVEGPSDRRLVTGVIPEDAVVVFEGGTRDAVLAAARELVALQMDRLACVVDRDFDDAVAQAHAEGLPVVAYDGADLEEMLVHSPAMHRMLGELGSEEKLADFVGVEAVIQRAREVGLPVARLRRGSANEGWALVFDAVDVYARVDKDSLELNVTGLCMALRATVEEETVSQADLEMTAADGEVVDCPRTGRPLVRGRDLLTVVSVALRRVVGTRTKARSAPDLLEEVLRSSIDLDWLRGTDWYAELIAVAAIQP
jgi:hypothetical protein